MSKDNNINKLVQEIKNAALKQLEDKIEQVRPEFQKNLTQKLDERVRDIFEEVVDEFYASYTPRFYERNEHNGMRKMIQTKITDSTFSYWFDEHMLSYRNGYSEEDGLYDTVFRKGWHGGAQLGSEMLVPYRTYKNKTPITYNGNGVNYWSPAKWQSPYEKYHSRWQKAKRAPIAPLDNFIKKKEEYEKNDLNKDAQQAWNDAWHSATKK